MSPRHLQCNLLWLRHPLFISVWYFYEWAWQQSVEQVCKFVFAGVEKKRFCQSPPFLFFCESLNCWKIFFAVDAAQTRFEADWWDWKERHLRIQKVNTSSSRRWRSASCQTPRKAEIRRVDGVINFFLEIVCPRGSLCDKYLISRNKGTVWCTSERFVRLHLTNFKCSNSIWSPQLLTGPSRHPNFEFYINVPVQKAVNYFPNSSLTLASSQVMLPTICKFPRYR